MGKTSTVKKYESALAFIIECLPEEKLVEIVDFANFLLNQYGRKAVSQINKDSLLLQQKSLSKIWDNPEEDLYEL